MKITRVELFDFRNYERCTFEPDPGVTVLYGDNAQGKTNILEAVYLTCAGRSHRTRQDKELIRKSAQLARIHVFARRRDGMHDVAIAIPSDGKRSVKIGGHEIARSGELMGHITGVLFSPEDLSIVKDGPSERRRFMDIAISQVNPQYYYHLQRMNRALRQRAAALKLMMEGRISSDAVDSWDEQLAKSSVELTRIRQGYISQLSAAAEEAHDFISGGREILRIKYQPATPGDFSATLSALARSRNLDLKLRGTSIGAHRDDLNITVNGSEVRTFGSQGQQRTVALSLRLAELDMVRRTLDEWPVLMLDDVMSELDPARRRQLVARLDGIQAIITCADRNDVRDTGISAAYRVSNAVLTPESGEAVRE